LDQGDEIDTEQKNQTNEKADKDACQQDPESAHHSPRHARPSRAHRPSASLASSSRPVGSASAAIAKRAGRSHLIGDKTTFAPQRSSIFLRGLLLFDFLRRSASRTRRR
jgi:hypothetical protein